MPGNIEIPADDERQAPTFPPGYFIDMLAEEYDLLLLARLCKATSDVIRLLAGRKNVTIVESTIRPRKTPQALLGAPQVPFSFWFYKRTICPYCGLELFPGADPETCIMKDQMEQAARAAIVRAIFTRAARRAWVVDLLRQLGAQRP